jgi:E3 ubiquitin-protein ligase HERC1
MHYSHRDGELTAFLLLLFGCCSGIGTGGKLGHQSEETDPVPRVVRCRGVYVAQVSVGLSHTAFVTQSGDVYTFGDGSFGKLGHENTTSIPVPRYI